MSTVEQKEGKIETKNTKQKEKKYQNEKTLKFTLCCWLL